MAGDWRFLQGPQLSAIEEMQALIEELDRCQKVISGIVAEQQAG